MTTTTTPTVHNPSPARLRLALVGWALLSATFAASGLMRQLPPFAIPATIWGLALSVLAGLRASPEARRVLARADLGPAFALHVLRAPIGVAFLWLGARGELDPTFVTVAGYGDIASGLGAIAAWIVWRAGPEQPTARWFVLGWNLVALVDILAVFVTAQRVLFFGGGMEAMQGFFRFPLPMLPTFVVPLVLLTHLWIFLRLRRPPPPA